MSRPRIFIDGEAGTTGLQIRARLAGRDDLTLVSLTDADRKNDLARSLLLNEVDLAVLCLPDQAARQAVAMVDNPAVKLLDASTAFRTDAGWVYGFAELDAGQPARIRAATRVSNPGCYPTGFLALVRPLVRAGLLPADSALTVQAVSGYSGGGRAMIDSFEGRGATPTNDAFQLYGLTLEHKHRFEMRQHAGLSRTPLFVPSVGRFAQGMLVQVPLQLATLPGAPPAARLHEVLADGYRGQRFVEVMPFAAVPATLSPEALNGSNRLQLFVFANDAEQTALLVARLDNLGKGASGAACQNIDLMLGLERAERDYSLAA